MNTQSIAKSLRSADTKLNKAAAAQQKLLESFLYQTFKNFNLPNLPEQGSGFYQVILDMLADDDITCTNCIIERLNELTKTEARAVLKGWSEVISPPTTKVFQHINAVLDRALEKQKQKPLTDNEFGKAFDAVHSLTFLFLTDDKSQSAHQQEGEKIAKKYSRLSPPGRVNLIKSLNDINSLTLELNDAGAFSR